MRKNCCKKPRRCCGRNFDEFLAGLELYRLGAAGGTLRSAQASSPAETGYPQFSETFIDLVVADTTKESARLGDLQELLSQCMEIPPADRDLFELRYQSDVPVKSLAPQLGRPISTIYNAINRIRRTLVECVRRASMLAQTEEARLPKGKSEGLENDREYRT